MKRLIGQIENFIKRIRWKAYFFEKDIVENGENEQGADENYGFKSNKTPPQNDGLNSFENDLYELVRGLEYESSRTKFRVLSVSKKHKLCLVECYPETGRSHQLRVHLELSGHPIVGDKKYGNLSAHTFLSPRLAGLCYQHNFLHELGSGLHGPAWR